MTDVTFPDRYHLAVEYVTLKYGGLEEAAEIEDIKKLALYALQMQADKGQCNEPAPYMWNVKERYKHSAWKQLGTLSKFEAMVHYVHQLEEVVGTEWLAAYRSLKGGDAASQDTIEAAATNEETTVPVAATSTAPTEAMPSSQTYPPLSDEVSAENIAALHAEIHRLRSMLEESTISTRAQPAHENTTRIQPQRVVQTTTPEADVEQPATTSPVAPVPPPALPPQYNQVPPPTALPNQAVETKTVKEQRAKAFPESSVYYTDDGQRTRNIGWLEWFGLSGPMKPVEHDIIINNPATAADRQWKPPGGINHPDHFTFKKERAELENVLRQAPSPDKKVDPSVI